MPTAAERSAIRRRLLSWFRKHARVLPWRQTRDPYAIWVSEVMLQQTQVATVVPYFERFLASFPRLADLAAATEQTVLRHWEGLGYYRRARDLHSAARMLMAEHDGHFPSDPDVLQSLPGFGRYTVGAVLSQSFDSRLPILEANSQRVLCRLAGVRDDPRNGPVRTQLWRLAEELLPVKHVGEFNQAMMELGALVCTSSSPDCKRCPLALQCVARKSGMQDAIPARSKRVAIEQVEEAAVVVRRGRRVLLVQRPAAGRWANMWEFPHGPLQDNESHDAAVLRLLEQLGIEARLGPPLMKLTHGVTRFRITITCLEARYRRGNLRRNVYQSGRWAAPEQLHEFPFSTPQRRLATSLF